MNILEFNQRQIPMKIFILYQRVHLEIYRTFYIPVKITPLFKTSIGLKLENLWFVNLW